MATLGKTAGALFWMFRYLERSENLARLIEAAAYLDGKMREIRGQSKLVGLERIAVMAALNIAHESLQARTELKQVGVDVGEELRKMNAKLEAALART